MQETLRPTSENDLLNEFETILTPASKGKRFVNGLIDYILIGFVLGILIQIFNGLSIALYGNFLVRYLIQSIFIVVFCSLEEIALKGKTIGKLITGTRAVNEDGTPMTAQTVLIRSLCRVVPFDGLSFIGNGWHDRWSHTIVIDERK